MDLHCRSARFSRCFPHDESGQHFLARTRNNILRKGLFIGMVVKIEKITRDYPPGNFHISPPKALLRRGIIHISPGETC